MNEVAVCIVADSSLYLASQWSIVITAYLSALLARLHEGRSNDSIYLGIITYATADYHPTPILAFRYFVNPQFVTKELKEDVLKLGIGRTGSGTKTGMAALEGYAAALDMFDLFLSTHRSSKEIPQDKQATDEQPGPLCHIIHLSASQPDDAQHPLWNRSSCLDTLSWKTLPDELRKRNINLNMISLKQNKSFSDLHSSVNPEVFKAWFKIPNEAHSVLLSSQASWAPLTVKRAEATEPDKATDAKKPRVSTPKQTPIVPPSQAPAPAPRPPKSTENDPPPASTQSNPPPPSFGLPQLQQAVAKMQELEPQLKQDQAQIEILRQQGRIQDMENLKRAVQPKMHMFYKLRQFVIVKSAAMAAANANSDHTKQAESRPEAVAGPSRQSQNPVPGSSNPQAQQIPSAQTIQQMIQAQRQAQQLNRPGTAASEVRPPPNILPQFSPNIAAQMQKLQAKEGIPGLSAMSHHQSQQQHPTVNLPGQNVSAMPQNQQAGQGENRNWLGSLSWMVPQTMNVTEAQLQMISNKPITPQTWPTTFELELLREQPVPLMVLKDWVNRHGPILCQIRPYPRSIDPQENVLRYKNLSALIHERNVYAVGRRAPASENPTPLMLLFPMGGDQSQLAAAVFPDTGVPELPRANSLPNPNPNPNSQAILGMRPATVGGQPGLPNINPQMLARLNNMTPEQRMTIIARLQAQAHTRAQLQAQQQAQAAGANAGNVNPVNPNSNPNPNPIVNLPGGVHWPTSAGVQGGQGNPSGMQGVMNPNLAQVFAALQQQRQGGMQPRPGSGGAAPF